MYLCGHKTGKSDDLPVFVFLYVLIPINQGLIQYTG